MHMLELVFLNIIMLWHTVHDDNDDINEIFSTIYTVHTDPPFRLSLFYRTSDCFYKGDLSNVDFQLPYSRCCCWNFCIFLQLLGYATRLQQSCTSRIRPSLDLQSTMSYLYKLLTSKPLDLIWYIWFWWLLPRPLMNHFRLDRWRYLTCGLRPLVAHSRVLLLRWTSVKICYVFLGLIYTVLQILESDSRYEVTAQRSRSCAIIWKHFSEHSWYSPLIIFPLY